MGLGLVCVIVALSAYLRFRVRQGEVRSASTWACGYAIPSPTMQYTSSSFAATLVRLFASVLRPKVRETPIEGLFAHEGRFESHVPDTVLDGLIQPLFRLIPGLFSRFRVFQQGSIQVYLSYILYGPAPAASMEYLVGDCSRSIVMQVIHILIHITLMIVMPPLLFGVIAKTKALSPAASGRPFFSPITTWQAARKGSVFSTTTTWVFCAGPVVGLATALVAILVVPLGSHGAPIAFMGDLVLFPYLFGLGSFFTGLAALDTGSSFEGMGAAREVTFACLAEPALFFGLLCWPLRVALAHGMLAGPLRSPPGPAADAFWSSLLSASSSCCSPRTRESRSTIPTRTSSSR